MTLVTYFQIAGAIFLSWLIMCLIQAYRHKHLNLSTICIAIYLGAPLMLVLSLIWPVGVPFMVYCWWTHSRRV